MGIFGAAWIRIEIKAIAADLSGSSLTYGPLADKAQIGYDVSSAAGTVLQPVAGSFARLPTLSTEDVLIEHLVSVCLTPWSGSSWSSPSLRPRAWSSA